MFIILPVNLVVLPDAVGRVISGKLTRLFEPFNMPYPEGSKIKLMLLLLQKALKSAISFSVLNG